VNEFSQNLVSAWLLVSVKLLGSTLSLETTRLRYNNGSAVCTRYDNLIPGIIAACRWGIESGKLMYPSTFGYVPAFVYMSHRPNDSFVPKQQRK
jgi:hypothetical protein